MGHRIQKRKVKLLPVLEPVKAWHDHFRRSKARRQGMPGTIPSNKLLVRSSLLLLSGSQLAESP